MSAGKKRGLAAVSSPDGVIAALALDHRASLVALMKAAAGEEPAAAQVEEFKRVVAQHLSPLASGVLLDQNYGQSAIKGRNKSTGLLLTYENDAYLNTHPEKLPTLISGASVKRLNEVKVSQFHGHGEDGFCVNSTGYLGEVPELSSFSTIERSRLPLESTISLRNWGRICSMAST
jgi:hypothetical protein